MPPLHPALVHFPIAFVVLSVVFDLAGAVRDSPRLREVGFWSLAAALVTGAATIALGYWDMNRANLQHQVHEYVHLHLKIGWALGIAITLLFFWRWRFWRRPEKALTPFYLGAGGLVLLLTLFQGWYGGELVYSHGAGVAAAKQGTESYESAKERLSKVHGVFSQTSAQPRQSE